MVTFTAQDAVGVYRVETGGFDEGDETTTASGTAKTFGRNVTVDTFEGANNGTELFEFSNRIPTQVIEQNFEGTFSVSFVLSTFQWLELFDDTVPTDLDSDETAGSDVTTDYNDAEPQTFELIVQRERATNDITRVATGCIAQSFEIDAQVDGTVNVTIDGVYANEYKRTGVDEAPQPLVTSSKDALNFADVSLSGPDSPTYSLPQGVTISAESSASLLSTLGSRVAGDFTVGPFTATVDTSHAIEVDNTNTLEDMYGSSTGVGDTVADDKSVTVTFDNTLDESTGGVKAEFTFTLFTDSYSESGIDVQEDFIEADVSEIVTGLTIDITE